MDPRTISLCTCECCAARKSRVSDGGCCITDLKLHREGLDVVFVLSPQSRRRRLLDMSVQALLSASLSHRRTAPVDRLVRLRGSSLVRK